MYDTGDVYADVYAGLYCVGCEAFKTRTSSSTGSARSTTRFPSGSRRRTGSSGSPPTRSACSRCTTAARLRAARVPLQRGAQLHRRAACRTSRSAARASRGACRSRGIPSRSPTSGRTRSINYLSALTYARQGEDLRERFWPAARHLLGKDILRFHCVFWPAMLLSAGYEVPQQLFVHGFLLLDDRKISKSLGNVIDPLDLIDVYGADAVRFWSRAPCRSGRTETFRSTACTSATSASSRTTSAISSRERRR